MASTRMDPKPSYRDDRTNDDAHVIQAHGFCRKAGMNTDARKERPHARR